MLKMAYVFILFLDVFGFIFPWEGNARRVLDTLYDAGFLHTIITNRISLLFIFNSLSCSFGIARNDVTPTFWTPHCIA